MSLRQIFLREKEKDYIPFRLYAILHTGASWLLANSIQSSEKCII